MKPMYPLSFTRNTLLRDGAAHGSCGTAGRGCGTDARGNPDSPAVAFGRVMP